MSDELKPCPVCGKQPVHTTWHTGDASVFCPVYHAELGKNASMRGKTLELAKAAWNAYELPAPPPFEREYPNLAYTLLQAENAQLRERLAVVEGWHDASEPPPYVNTVAGKPKAMEIDYSEPVEVAFMYPTVPYRRKRVRVGGVVQREVWETDSGIFDGKYEIKDNHPIASSMRVIAWREQPAAPQGGDHER